MQGNKKIWHLHKKKKEANRKCPQEYPVWTEQTKNLCEQLSTECAQRTREPKECAKELNESMTMMSDQTTSIQRQKIFFKKETL